MQIVKKIVLFPLTIIGIVLIYFYKFCISPFLPNVCRYYPTCSSYALQSIKSYGFLKGAYLAIKRILRCRGKHKGGLDYIPDNIKGEFKWLV